uniref:Elongation of very long chain fatty acids protein n=1 Tax=Culicoides sonorensis TaxID=179676 RepID=A0A336LRW1_CULSO
MAFVLKKIIELHFYWNDECSDPRVKDWPLMKDPLAGLCILGAYLYFVKSLGPRLMQDRKPFKLDGIMKIYNIIQVLLCGMLVIDGIRFGFFTKYSLLCEPVDYTRSTLGMQTAVRAYGYFLIKVVDLLDTVFFVLRKKQNQVTFLHVYHHTGMVMLSWAGAKYFPGGHSVFMGLLNSFVHVVMYAYYYLTSVNEKYKKNIWWKKHITQLQMIQFGLIAIHWIVLLFKPWLKSDCNFPRWPVFILVPQNLFMFLSIIYEFELT